MVMEWDQQSFNDPRLRGQRWKMAIREIHELRLVLVDARAAGAGITRHGAMPAARVNAREGFPPKHISIEQTHADCLGVAQFDRDLRQLLQHVAGVYGHFGDQERKGTALAIEIWLATRASVQLSSDVDVCQRDRRRSGRSSLASDAVESGDHVVLAPMAGTRHFDYPNLPCPAGGKWEGSQHAPHCRQTVSGPAHRCVGACRWNPGRDRSPAISRRRLRRADRADST